MGNQDEQFCLKWNDFQQCIKSTFQDLRDEDDFMDVTLSCDGEQIRAHKVILSACSLTFRNLLKKNPTQNPVILLWDMSPRDLSAILDFMYNGEVNVKQEHLNSFLSVAEKLRVRGLCQSDSKPPPPHKDKESTKVKHRRSSITAPSKDAVIVQSETPPIKRAKYDEEDNDDIQEIAPVAPTTPQVKTEAGSYSASAVDAVAAASQPLQVAGEAFAEEYTEQEDYGEYYDEEGNYGVDPVDQSQAGKGMRKCEVCGKTFSRSDSLKTHIRDLHLNTGMTFMCRFCGKPAKSLNALKVHTSIYHRNVNNMT